MSSGQETASFTDSDGNEENDHKALSYSTDFLEELSLKLKGAVRARAYHAR
jgi:hypothetical protein